MVIDQKKENRGQAAVEYMLLLAVVVAFVLVAFPMYLPDLNQSANQYYNAVVVGIYGPANPCGDGVCSAYESQASCCVDCVGCT